MKYLAIITFALLLVGGTGILVLSFYITPVKSGTVVLRHCNSINCARILAFDSIESCEEFATNLANANLGNFYNCCKESECF